MNNTSEKLYFCLVIFLLFLLQHCSFSRPSVPELSPEISITYNSSVINPNQEIRKTDYSGNPSEISFVIINKGEVPLEISNLLLTSGSDAFKINKEPQPSVSPGEQTEFSLIYFSGEKSNTAHVLIKSNGKGRNNFSFSISYTRSDIKIYYTGPDYDSSLENALVEKIRNQTDSEYLDLCLYGLDRESIITEVESAISKGVHVSKSPARRTNKEET